MHHTLKSSISPASVRRPTQPASHGSKAIPVEIGGVHVGRPSQLGSCAQELDVNTTSWLPKADAVCYEYAGVPPEQQLSAMPAADDTGAKYYRGFGADKA